MGNLTLNVPAAEQFSKGIVDKKINIRPDNRERTFARTTIANFLYTLEAQSRRVKVTMITIENSDRRVKNHEIPKDQWTFLADITSRQRSIGAKRPALAGARSTAWCSCMERTE